MRITRCLTIVALVVCATAPLAPPTALADTEVPPALVRKEEAALKKCAAELLKLSKWCTMHKSIDHARSELRRGLEIRPDDPKLTRELARIEGKDGTPRKGFAAAFAAKRDAAHAKCVAALAGVAQLYDKADLSEPFDRLLDRTQSQFPGAEAVKTFGLVYFEPYVKWVREADIERLGNGRELVEGDWLDADAVAALDAEHTSWDDPWVVSDEVHEVQTTMSLRTARSVLAHAAAMRKFILRYFDGEWDLRTPKGKLPVIVTNTQAELRERLAAASGGRIAASPQAAAFYMASSEELNPCFVTFEPMMAGGGTVAIDFPELLFALKHEVGHQVAFEYSKHADDASRLVEHQIWSVEGVANFLPFYVLSAEGWTLTRPRMIPMAGGGAPGAFAWAKDNRSQLPPISEFVQTSRTALTVETYHYAATLAYFLLEGADRRYRDAFIELLATVHTNRDTADLWQTSFPPAGQTRLQEEFLAFVAALDIDG